MTPSKQALNSNSAQEDEEDANLNLDEENVGATHDNIENFNDLVISTQMSQKNYIMSRGGDTLEDLLEDGVTPTPKDSRQIQFKRPTTEIDQFKKILAEFNIDNR